jgi:hypothetical protein
LLTFEHFTGVADANVTVLLDQAKRFDDRDQAVAVEDQLHQCKRKNYKLDTLIETLAYYN